MKFKIDLIFNLFLILLVNKFKSSRVNLKISDKLQEIDHKISVQTLAV